VNFQVLPKEHILYPTGEIYLPLPWAKPSGTKVRWHCHRSYGLKACDKYDMKKAIIIYDNVVYNENGIFKRQKETNNAKMAQIWWKVHACCLYLYVPQMKGIQSHLFTQVPSNPRTRGPIVLIVLGMMGIQWTFN
jgi:hypothetical protein